MECTPQELAAKGNAGASFLLLDVRTEEELDIASLTDAHHIPLDELEARAEELAPWRGQEIICMCHHGMRSQMAQQILLRRGFTNVKNLTGGIHAYALEVDNEVPLYG